MRIDQYVFDIRNFIGKGGFGSVYAGQDLEVLF